MRGATVGGWIGDGLVFISIHAPREGCDEERAPVYGDSRISIHAPREGCDIQAILFRVRLSHFNPHTPRGVRPPLWLCGRPRISIHAPREGCDLFLHNCLRSFCISIHAPREGCDSIWFNRSLGRSIFQSTHPVRGAT